MLVPDSYVSALCKEIDYRLPLHGVKEIGTVYVGGGTPSLLTKNQFETLFAKIKNTGLLKTDAEITVEVNPDDVSSELLKTLEGCGVNRISCGIQSMNDAALKKACRRADASVNQKALSLFKQEWKGELSLDLISGLPGDDETSLQKSLDLITAVNPSHISLYSLTIEVNTPFGKQLESGELAYDFDKADDLWLYGRDYLEKQGYEWYEVSNFCMPGKACRHNLCYWTHGDYLGIGSGATGTVYGADGQGLRWTNSNKIEKYIDFWKEFSPSSEATPPQVSESIDRETSQFEFFMMGLRKLEGICEEDYAKLFDQPLPESFLEVFSRYEQKGLCEKRTADNRTYYAMSRAGMLFLNRFLEELC